MTPRELRERAAEPEAELRADDLGPEDRRGAAELLAALAAWDPALLRRAALADAGDGKAGLGLLLEAVECAEDERV